MALGAIEGTGTRGRIMIGDVERAIEKMSPKIETVGKGREWFGKTIPMTQIRKVIAKRMAQSAFTAPHIYFFTDVEMDRLNQLREEILSEFEKQFKVRISINDFLMKAVALTICEFPMLNAMVKGEEIYIHPEINVGLAVAMEEGAHCPCHSSSGPARSRQNRPDEIGPGRASQNWEAEIRGD